MAWWGVAIAYGPNMNRPMPPEDVSAAWEALQKARAAAPHASAREQALIAALAKRYVAMRVDDRAMLEKAYGDAMREVANNYPEDNDVQALFAESLMDMMPWDYYEKNGQPKSATKEILAALEGVLQRDPLHPGANHYYIHAVEAQTPEKALAFADRLLQLCPGAGHLVTCRLIFTCALACIAKRRCRMNWRRGRINRTSRNATRRVSIPRRTTRTTCISSGTPTRWRPAAPRASLRPAISTHLHSTCRSRKRIGFARY